VILNKDEIDVYLPYSGKASIPEHVVKIFELYLDVVDIFVIHHH